MEPIKHFLRGFITVICLFLITAASCCYAASAPIQENKVKPLRILTIEGGGVYGVLSARILQAIEQKAHRPVSQLFDMMVGTSTGSIQIALLNTPKPGTSTPLYSSVDILDFYLTFAQSALDVSWQRRLLTLNGLLAPLLTQDKLEEYARKKLGNTQLKNLLTHALIPVYDLNTAALFIFDSQNPKEGDYLLRNILLASTAIPNIFPVRSFQMQGQTHYLTDATVVANNPTLLAVLYANFLNPKQPKIIVSIGAGNRSPAENLKAQGNQGLAGALENWLGMIYQGTDDSFHHMLETAVQSHTLNLIAYYRLNPAMPKNIGSPIDASSQNIALLKESADKYIQANNQQLTYIVKQLIQDED